MDINISDFDAQRADVDRNDPKELKIIMGDEMAIVFESEDCAVLFAKRILQRMGESYEYGVTPLAREYCICLSDYKLLREREILYAEKITVDGVVVKNRIGPIDMTIEQLKQKRGFTE